MNTFNDSQKLLNYLFEKRGANYSLESTQTANDDLLSFENLKGIKEATHVLQEAIEQGKHILIAGDFDADGATATALLVNYLRKIGHKNTDYIIPNRFKYAYGLTTEIVEDIFNECAENKKPDLIITVDNGISSIKGVALAKSYGAKVIITDHHLPGDQIPDADAIVNPNQKGCAFESNHLAGVGVAYYLAWAMNEHLDKLGYFEQKEVKKPLITNYLDLVALGTIADVVALDHNNRLLVRTGLSNIRRGHCRAGIKALIEISNRSIENLTSGDLAFAVGPRLNAAGRLEDMSNGIACLLCPRYEMAIRYADNLNELNLTRKEVEFDMQEKAIEIIEDMKFKDDLMGHSLCLYQEDWHQGVIGILASRIKEMVHKPVVIFTKSKEGTLKGSSRSVQGVHIKDVITNLDTLYPGLILSFGGHSMAAGLSIEEKDFERFRLLFNEQIEAMGPLAPKAEQPVDCQLAADILNTDTVTSIIEAGPWGRAFPESLFYGRFSIVSQKLVGENHLKLVLSHCDEPLLLDGIKFFVDKDQWPQYDCQLVDLKYRLSINNYRNISKIQLIIEDIQPASMNDDAGTISTEEDEYEFFEG